MVEPANPIPTMAAHTRRTATTTIATISPPMDWARNKGPMIEMWRYPSVSFHRWKWM